MDERSIGRIHELVSSGRRVQHEDGTDPVVMEGGKIFDTRGVAPARRFDLWSATVASAPAPIQIETEARLHFRGRLQEWSAHALMLAEINATAHDVIRGRREISRGSQDEVKLVLVNAGTAILRQNNHQLFAAPGDVMVCFDDRSFHAIHRERTFLQSVCVSAQRFSVDIRSITPQLISKNSSPLAPLVSSYLRSMPRDRRISAEMADFVVSQLIALIERALVRQPDSAVVSSERKLYDAALASIEAEIGDPNLSAKLLCARLGISRSSLFAAMAAQGHTLAGLILSRRMAGCIQDMKQAPREQTLAAIAERWGFANQETFNRAFRRQYAQTPTEWRRNLDRAFE